VGSGIGGLPLIEENHDEFVNRGARRISPFLIPGSIINMISGSLSIMFGLRGPNLAVATACTTGLHSIGLSGYLIERGDADIMVAGGAEATVSPLGIGGFAAMQALSTRNDDPATASRPWDKDRDGFVLAKARACSCWKNLNMPGGAMRAFTRVGRFRHERRRISHDRAGCRRPTAGNDQRVSQRRVELGRGAVPERARHLDAFGRRQRDQRDQACSGRCGAQVGGQFDQIDDRTSAGRRRRT